MSIPDKEFKNLMKMVDRVKVKTLFEEPCPLYEPGWDDVTESEIDWIDFWSSEDK